MNKKTLKETKRYRNQVGWVGLLLTSITIFLSFIPEFNGINFLCFCDIVFLYIWIHMSIMISRDKK